jgi:N-acetylglucosaminyl-diphospho-decaprenol L-rhamnosyltransferase
LSERRRLAVALVTHNSEHDLSRFLPGQLAAAEQVQAPLVVADNGSTDGTLALLRSAMRDHPSLIVREMGRNAGYSAAVNAAFARTPDRDVLLINPDVELPGREPILALARVLERVPTAAIAAPRLIGEDGEVQPNARLYPSLAGMIGSTGLGSVIPALGRRYQRFVGPSQSEAPVTVDWVIGAAMMIRRVAFEEVGGWDEGFFLYIEDAEFCRACVRAGWDVVYVPQIRLRHIYPRASRTTGSFATSRARRSHVAGLARLWRKEPRLMLGHGRGKPRAVDVGIEASL